MSASNRKLVVLGIPWDADTAALQEHMSKFGELDDVIVMKDRTTGRSRGFGYVTFASPECAEKVLATQHTLNGRPLDVKIATPKEDMKPPSTNKATRIFVARIPPSVTDEMFRKYFLKYGTIIDAYMPKDYASKAHRGIGFVTYENSEAVDKLMSETHEMAGSTIAVDRATPKEETMNFWAKALFGAYGAYGLYTQAACSGALGGSGTPPFGAFNGVPSFGAYDANANYPGMGYLGSSIAGAGLSNDASAAAPANPYALENAWQTAAPLPGALSVSGVGAAGANATVSHVSGTAPTAPSKPLGNKIFVGRLPLEATTEDLQRYFSNFGRIMDVYIPKDAKKLSHRGFGFVTFFDESAVELISTRTHKILGQEVAIDRAAALGESPPDGAFMRLPIPNAGDNTRDAAAAIASSIYGAMPGSVDFTGGWGSYGAAAASTLEGALPGALRTSRTEPRYRPY